MTDEQLEALLRQTQANLPDEGFTAAVMQRVRALPVAIAPGQALVTLQRRQDGAQRDRDFSRYGAAAGVALALAMLAATKGVPADLAADGARMGLALMISGAALAWTLLNETA
jgi:hypothetical protein